MLVSRCSEADSGLQFEDSPNDNLFETSISHGLILGGIKSQKYMYEFLHLLDLKYPLASHFMVASWRQEVSMQITDKSLISLEYYILIFP